jgi:hypothetical protein
MTWVTHYGADGAHVLDLLVLWRGTPGWFMANTSGAGTSGGGRTGFYQTTIRYGGLELQLSFDGAARTAHIQGKPVKLGDDNVILVDHVNSAEGPQVASTLRVEPDVPAGEGTRPRVEEVVRRAPEIVDFLQCGAVLPGGKNQALIDRLCTMMLGK